jgi:pimeloyl-ACP methyl ester carboxylesterase
MDHALHAIDQGAGTPLLLVHGFPFDHTMWRYQTEALSQTNRVVAADLRGFGQSPIEHIASKTGVAMADYADDLARLLDARGIDGPVVFCGLSMGGYIGWEFFKRHRHRVRALIQCDTRAAADTPQARETRYRMAESVEGWGSAHVAALMAPKLMSAGTLNEDPKLVEEVQQIISRTNPVAIAAAQRGMAHREDKTALLPTIDVPVIYLVGVDDQISPPAEMKAMADATPNAEYVVIPDAAHMSPMENPRAVNRAVGAFLERLD